MSKLRLTEKGSLSGIVKYQQQSMPGKFTLVDLNGKKILQDTGNGWTHSLRSINAHGLRQCLQFEPNEIFRVVTSEETIVADSNKSLKRRKRDLELLKLMPKCRIRKVSAIQLNSFLDLCQESSDVKFADYANKYGLLFYSPRDTASLHELLSPLQEPITAWQVESYVMSLTYRAIKKIRVLEMQNLDQDMYQAAFYSYMEKIWSNHPAFLAQVRMPQFTHALISGKHRPKEILGWNEIITGVLNYYLLLLTRPSINLKENKTIMVTPCNQLGALWLEVISTYWAPSPDARFCRECGCSLAKYAKQRRYCDAHRTPAAKQRRKRM